jgi:hypothetical protein
VCLHADQLPPTLPGSRGLQPPGARKPLRETVVAMLSAAILASAVFVSRAVDRGDSPTTTTVIELDVDTKQDSSEAPTGDDEPASSADLQVGNAPAKSQTSEHAVNSLGSGTIRR